MLSRIIPITCLTAVVLAVCYRSTAPATAQAAHAQYPPIVRLQSRNYSIDISAGPRSPLYSITNSAGQLLVSNISLEDLRIAHADLFALLAPALAPKATASAVSPVISADDR